MGDAAWLWRGCGGECAGTGRKDTRGFGFCCCWYNDVVLGITIHGATVQGLIAERASVIYLHGAVAAFDFGSCGCRRRVGNYSITDMIGSSLLPR